MVLYPDLRCWVCFARSGSGWVGRSTQLHLDRATSQTPLLWGFGQPPHLDQTFCADPSSVSIHSVVPTRTDTKPLGCRTSQNQLCRDRHPIRSGMPSVGPGRSIMPPRRHDRVACAWGWGRLGSAWVGNRGRSEPARPVHPFCAERQWGALLWAIGMRWGLQIRLVLHRLLRPSGRVASPHPNRAWSADGTMRLDPAAKAR